MEKDIATKERKEHEGGDGSGEDLWVAVRGDAGRMIDGMVAAMRFGG